MPDNNNRRLRPTSLPIEPRGAGGADEIPGRRAELAEEIVDALLSVGADDPALALSRADALGLVTLGDSWSRMEVDTRPGVLWVLHLLRAWLHFHGQEASRFYQAGTALAPVQEVVAGTPDLPTADELSALGDTLLTTAYGGNLAGAADRAAALLRVIASGGALLAADDELSQQQAVRARQGAERLAAGAAFCRRDESD
jgi:hypothetical protein